ncbi:MAG: peptidoglycan-binding domain-containing protein [bacterium]|nr:peptidoglycan-binding domain-containing protein [bacterium]
MDPVPEYMDKGSHGPHVTILQAFLCGWGDGGNIEFDQDYGDVTADLVGKFQSDRELDVDSNCGPETRQSMLETDGFDFAAACASVPGTTVFKHGDEEIEWTSPASGLVKKDSSFPIPE